ncbi:PREDICTED: zinc finger protein 318 isoform X1 [Papilio xuthus]|uniref:Zinc finger protein 318 isoform X1 n=2 Tax=Papilio xuthus TaxID=66420 RepID=A0AAJ7E3X9_PAPXU|nr:PREDICTED: zinc finger protein 318 isoform X1 [Papilio xuthus]
MSRDVSRKSGYDRGGGWDRNYYRNQTQRKRSRSPPIREGKRRSRSPQKSEKDILDDNILNEISKLPEPNELWDSQFQEGFSGNAPPSFTRDGGNYPRNYQQPYPVNYDNFGSAMPPMPPGSSGWSQPAPAQPVFNNVEEQIKKEAAIESEMRHQKAALSKQREDCMKKATILKKELETLKEQRSELHSDSKRSPSPDTKRFLKENTKLQLEIQNKLKTINNVVDMLNGIIGEEVDKSEVDDSGERSSKRKSRSPSTKRFNYVYYDPEMHWCRVCNEFPATAKDYLTHLHSPSHHKMASSHMEAPWHSVAGMNEGFPNYPSAPTKRTPIRGLQFFVPSTAWYCKLCDQFIGDLHCASAHLKSIIHSKNYTNFVEQNPHWDTDWMSDRQKAFEKSRAKAKAEEKPPYAAHTITFSKDGFHTKRKASPDTADKKRKKDRRKKKKNKKRRSSSESSSSSSSDSDNKKRKKKKETVIDKNALSQWMSSIPVNFDRKLLDNLKYRVQKERRKSPSRDDQDRRGERRSDSKREDRQERRDDRRNERPDKRDDRERRDDRRETSDRREERTERRNESQDTRDNQSRSVQQADVKKTEIKKMPFIGKMPVFKNLSKTAKNEEQKKEEEKKKHEEEVIKKKREEMDAEIQKKVAIFKEKIAKAQLEKQQQEMGLALPPLAFLPPPCPPCPPQLLPPPIPPPQPASNLPKDFQEALDIIFPSNAKPSELTQSELFVPGLPPGFAPMPPVPFPHHMGLVQSPIAQLSPMSPMMMGFDVNQQVLPPARPQLYDTQVPIVPGHQNSNNTESADAQKTELKEKNKEELEELAMLGIDASDVGAGI